MKRLLPILTLALTLVFSGCSRSLLGNGTPSHLQQNPSGIYTFTLSSKANRHAIVPETLRAEMIVNGQVVPMKPVTPNNKLFAADFRIPSGQTEVRYYYRLAYRTNEEGVKRDHEYTSELYTSRLVNRYVLSLESERGPVGATIAVMGRGFSQYDTVVVGQSEAPTRFFSSNALQFTVPAVEGGKTYDVFLRTGNGDLLIGSFTVDASALSVLPANLELTSGGSAVLVFSIDNEAPAGGLPVNVVTDIPSSIVMPEVSIPAGSRSVSITVEGGSPASGKLVASAPGYQSATIPVSVR